MATFSKIPLTGSVNGKGVNIAATGSVGTTLHTAVSSTQFYEEIWMYCVNTSASAAKLTLEYGGTASADNIEVTVASENGLMLVIPGLFLNNSLSVTAFSSIANVLTIHGYAHRVES